MLCFYVKRVICRSAYPPLGCVLEDFQTHWNWLGINRNCVISRTGGCCVLQRVSVGKTLAPARRPAQEPPPPPAPGGRSARPGPARLPAPRPAPLSVSLLPSPGGVSPRGFSCAEKVVRCLDASRPEEVEPAAVRGCRSSPLGNKREYRRYEAEGLLRSSGVFPSSWISPRLQVGKVGAAAVCLMSVLWCLWPGVVSPAGRRYFWVFKKKKGKGNIGEVGMSLPGRCWKLPC